MKNNLRTLTLAALAFAGVGSAFAQDAYAVDTFGNLNLVNLPTGTATYLGSTGLFLESLAYDQASGRLFGHGTGGDFHELNPANGAVINSMSTGLGNVEAMDFTSVNSILYGFDFAVTATIYTIDPNTGLATAFTTMDQPYGSVRAFAFDPTDTNAIFAGDGPTAQTLTAMNTSGVTTIRGTLASFTAAIDFDSSGQLWGLGSGGEVFMINDSDGSMTTVANTGGQFWLGMASARVVPEPASMIALGTALVGLAARRRRK